MHTAQQPLESTVFQINKNWKYAIACIQQLAVHGTRAYMKALAEQLDSGVCSYKGHGALQECKQNKNSRDLYKLTLPLPTIVAFSSRKLLLRTVFF